MKTRAPLVVAFLCFTLVAPLCGQNSAPPSPPQPGRKAGPTHKRRLPEKEYDLAAGAVSGDKVRGPRRIIAKNLNTLRYNYSLSRAVSFTAPGDLWSKLSGVTAAGVETAPKAAEAPKKLKAGPPEPCQKRQKDMADQAAIDAFCEAEEVKAKIDEELSGISNLKTDGVDPNREELDRLLDQIQKAVASVTLAGRLLREKLQANSPVPNGILQDINDMVRENPESAFLAGAKANWADASDVKNLRTSAENLKKEVDREKSAFPAFITEQSAVVAALQATLSAKITSLKEQQKEKREGAEKPSAEPTPVGKRPAPAQAPVTSAERLASSITALEGKTKELEQAKNDLLTASTSLDWATRENDKILAAIPDLEEGSAKYTAFIEAREKLLDWKARMEALRNRWNEHQDAVAKKSDGELHPNPFDIVAEGDCEFAFGGAKTTTITITRIDQLPGNNNPPEAVLSVVVECTSPFTVSAGVVFSTVLQQEFAIRPLLSAVDGFVATSKSHFHPLPLGMIHARFWEPNEEVAFHASFGTAGNLRSQGAGGSDAEFLLGISFSLFRTMFITPGLHLGQRVDLSSGFKEGGAVPSGITEPPLTKSHKARFGLAITFTKP